VEDRKESSTTFSMDIPIYLFSKVRQTFVTYLDIPIYPLKEYASFIYLFIIKMMFIPKTNKENKIKYYLKCHLYLNIMKNIKSIIV
jgi:hypothetical protein